MFNLFAPKSEKITLIKEILNDLDYLYDDLNDLNISDRNERKCIESKINVRENLLNNLSNK